MIVDDVDYSDRGMSIQKAKMDQLKRFPDKGSRPESLQWGELNIKTSYPIDCSKKRKIKIEFLSEADENQGVDLKVDGGFLVLNGGQKVTVLRTWHDPDYEPDLTYELIGDASKIWIYNVYKETRSGRVFEEKWTNNAGLWVSEIDRDTFIFHCSPGWESPPDFDSLVFKITTLDE